MAMILVISNRLHSSLLSFEQIAIPFIEFRTDCTPVYWVSKIALPFIDFRTDCTRLLTFEQIALCKLVLKVTYIWFELVAFVKKSFSNQFHLCLKKIRTDFWNVWRKFEQISVLCTLFFELISVFFSNSLHSNLLHRTKIILLPSSKNTVSALTRTLRFDPLLISLPFPSVLPINRTNSEASKWTDISPKTSTVLNSSSTPSSVSPLTKEHKEREKNDLRTAVSK